MTARFVQLPVSKAVIDLDNISMIGQAEVNKFVAFPKTGQNGAVFDGNDKDALLAHLEETGQLARLKELPKIAA